MTFGLRKCEGTSNHPYCSQNAQDEKDGKGTSLVLCPRNRERGWSLLISCARATRGLGTPSPGLMARLGVPVGGRVRKSRAAGDHLVRPGGLFDEKRLPAHLFGRDPRGEGGTPRMRRPAGCVA